MPRGPGQRRRLLLLLLLLSAGAASFVLGTILAASGGLSLLDLAILVLFFALFAWISTAFWIAAWGLVLSVRPPQAAPSGAFSTARSATVLVMPVYNEAPARTSAGLRATLTSLCQSAPEGRFDAFILSDTTDPETWLAEELAWSRLARDFAGRIDVFYRHRPRNLARKSGNIAQFCKTWGAAYDYMVVLDADSVMSGGCLVELVDRMEANPRLGLLQVPPLPVLRESLFARCQQFASSVYGRPFTTGLAYFFDGSSNYWGHNAIIRLAPFMAHCGLPELPGREPFGGEILSHDFVEAALLRRAGWEVHLAADLEGSYEEPPPTLIDHAKRDRRWCQGNLQHLGLATARGLHPVSRLHFAMGAMSYLSSPLWLLLLVLSGLEAWRQSQSTHSYFIDGALFPDWPVSYAFEATTLLAITLAILYLPKVFGYLCLLRDRRRLQAHGGALRAGVSLLLESLLSILLAPILMLFQSGFILSILSGRSVHWAAQQRDDGETSWREALAAHGSHCLLALAVGTFCYGVLPAYFWWLTPVLLGPLLSLPLSRLTSRSDLGRRLRAWGLFLVPAESAPPALLRDLKSALASDGFRPDNTAAPAGLFERAMEDPALYMLHCSLLSAEARSRHERLRLKLLVARLQEEGPASLSPAERRELLGDPEAMASLYATARQARDAETHGPT